MSYSITDENRADVRRRLDLILCAMDWDYGKLAEATGMARETISLAVTGSGPWTARTLMRMAKALDVSPEVIFLGTAVPTVVSRAFNRL